MDGWMDGWRDDRSIDRQTGQDVHVNLQITMGWGGESKGVEGIGEAWGGGGKTTGCQAGSVNCGVAVGFSENTEVYFNHQTLRFTQQHSFL